MVMLLQIVANVVMEDAKCTQQAFEQKLIQKAVDFSIVPTAPTSILHAGLQVVQNAMQHHKAHDGMAMYVLQHVCGRTIFISPEKDPLAVQVTLSILAKLLNNPSGPGLYDFVFEKTNERFLTQLITQHYASGKSLDALHVLEDLSTSITDHTEILVGPRYKVMDILIVHHLPRFMQEPKNVPAIKTSLRLLANLLGDPVPLQMLWEKFQPVLGRIIPLLERKAFPVEAAFVLRNALMCISDLDRKHVEELLLPKYEFAQRLYEALEDTTADAQFLQDILDIVRDIWHFASDELSAEILCGKLEPLCRHDHPDVARVAQEFFDELEDQEDESVLRDI